ncbi:MAG: hsp90 co-chaperone Cdc37 [Piccolia ochrophora]|nr:MAG: hsp90 co-chaperone Cdc37 [Piccolia ochrophora]
MVLNYSKWDNLELSDDSDIEVHPNVDKRSFIRAKQTQIHQERFQRRHQIDTFKYERIVNDGLLKRISTLIDALQSHHKSSSNPDELVFQALIESAGDPSDDQPPTPPEGVHSKVEEQPTYSRMMAALVDQTKKEVDKSNPENRFDAYVKEIKRHQTKVRDLQKELLSKLSDLEKEEARKITSDSIHTGFDSSSVSKGDGKAAPGPGGSEVKSVEVLNPRALKKDPLKRMDSASSGAEADIEEAANDGGEEDEADIEASKLGKDFGKIKMGDYRTSLQYISAHPSVVAERESEGLLIEAFHHQMEGRDELARQCVHQGLLLSYCRKLGRDGVSLFFKRITTQHHQAQKVFFDDVNSTHAHIRTRARAIANDRAADAAAGNNGNVEQIQLHPVEPGTQIKIVVPQPNSEDEVERTARDTFESFPPGLRRALESASLDEVNKVLGKMSVEEAEEVVAKLSEGGMLNLDKEVFDATTEEGQEKMKEIEEYEKQVAEQAKAGERTEDPA